MKKLNLVILLLTFSAFAQAGVNVITDLDDTLKITNAGNPIEATVNGIVTQSIFTGMNDFLYAEARDGHKTFVVSSSPPFLRGRINALFYKFQIEVETLFTRNPIKEKNFAYKKRVISEILASSNEEFILLGDDVDEDHLIYNEIIMENPGRIKVAYIHVIKGRELPASVTPYYTALDLSLHENTAGRIDNNSVERVLSAMKDQEKLQRIFPKFSVCPSAASTWAWYQSTSFGTSTKDFTDKLLDYCRPSKQVEQSGI